MPKFLPWLWIGALGVGFASLLLSISGCARKPARAAPAAEHAAGPADSAFAVRVEVLKPELGGIEHRSVQPGSVIAFESADLFAKVSGYLKSQSVDIGSLVKRGELLAEIDAPELVSAVQQASAALEEAKTQVKYAESKVSTALAQRDALLANITKAEADVDRTIAVCTFREKQYARIKSLRDLKSIDARLVDEKQDERDSARAAVQAAEASVVTARAQVAAANARIDQAKADVVEARAKVGVAEAVLAKAQVFVEYTKIVSPYDGVITMRNFFRGAFIRSPDQGGEVPLLGVSRTDLMRVVVQVPDRDVPYTAVGNEATIQIDALPGTTLTGKVARLADSEDPTTRTMRTEIDLPNPDDTLREGMYGRVIIHLAHGKASLTVPSSALVNNSNKVGMSELFIVQGNVARLRRVRTGADNGLRIEILDGLKPDDAVIVEHQGALADGTPVEAIPADKVEG